MSALSFLQLPSAALPVLRGSLSYAGAMRLAAGSMVDQRLRQHDPAAVGVGLYAAPPHELQVPALPVARLSITLTPARVTGGLDGDPPQRYESARHALFLVPAGAAAHWRKEWPGRHLSLFFDADTLADSGFCKDAMTLGDKPLLNACVPGIRALADELLAELEEGNGWSAEAADSLGRLLLIKVARQRNRLRASGNPLTPQLLSRLIDHVQAHLSERILVSDLAAVVGLSPSRFAMAYTACAGQSPHQFVMAQRLRRAQTLLRDDRLPLAQVAADCGFASQQHLTQVIRKRLGVTPARYRSAQCAGPRGVAGGPGAATV